MRKPIYHLIILAIIALVSCSKENTSEVPVDTSTVTFNISTHTPDTKAIYITRYIMEAYKAGDLTTLVKRVEQSSSSIVVNLENNATYTCLFWADEVAPDDNINGTYNASNLKNVTLNYGKVMGEAFFANKDITSAESTVGIVLKRATAQVNFIETGTIEPSKDLKVTFRQYPNFSASSSDATGTAVEETKTFNTTATTGKLGSFLTFASVAGVNTDFTVSYDVKTVNNILYVPLKTNYITNIRGSYDTGAQYFTFIVEIDDNWEDLIPGVQINVGTAEAPAWIKVADRNADKNKLNGAAIGNSATHYGYYYQWSDVNNDPTNADKAYMACFDFDNGNGSWRLPTKNEWSAITGNGDNTNINSDAIRKLKWTNSGEWRLHDERSGQTASYVVFPLAGLNNISYGPTPNNGKDETASYWTGTAADSSNAWHLYLNMHGYSGMWSNNGMTHGFSVRCVKNV